MRSVGLFFVFILFFNQEAFSQSSCLQNFQENLVSCPLCRIILGNSNQVCNNSSQCYYVDTYVFQAPYFQDGVIITYLNLSTCIQVRQEEQQILTV